MKDNKLKRASVRRLNFLRAATVVALLGIVINSLLLLAERAYVTISNNQFTPGLLIVSGLLAQAIAITYLSYRLSFAQLRNSRLKPKRHALQTVLATIVGDILMYGAMFVLVPIGGKIFNFTPPADNPPANYTEPGALITAVFILMSLIPYLGVKIIIYFAAQARAEREKEELFG
jgi:hypothetical protein